MQKPDANGYVHITWPSKNIPHGGIFHTPKVQFTEKQQKFLKVLMEESKLTLAQRRKSAFKLRESGPMPPRVSDEQLLEGMLRMRPRTSKRRSLSAIRASGVYEMDEPLKRGEDREKLKDKLAYAMAYGDTGGEISIQPPARIKLPDKIQLPTKKDMWNDLIEQIRERAEWLQEMEDLGHAGPHRDVIQNEIAVRLKALEDLEVDSECSSVGGFSTTRSREAPVASNRSNRSRESAMSNQSRMSDKSEKSVKSGKSNKSGRSDANVMSSLGRKVDSGKSEHSRGSAGFQQRKPGAKTRGKEQEESVEAYEHHKILQHSPRRRQ